MPPSVPTPAPPPLLQSPLLSSWGIAHGFSTRATATDASLCVEALGLAPQPIFQVEQVHGRRVLVCEADPVPFRQREADGIVAPGVAWGVPSNAPIVGVRVADCVPVLVADLESGGVAALHAGWRGIVAGVIQEGLRILRETSVVGPAVPPSPPAVLRFIAAIGPCIGPCCFEVGTEVVDALQGALGPLWLPPTSAPGTWSSNAVATVPSQGKAFVNLRMAVRLLLEREGLPMAAIDEVPGCTRCEADRFHSFRRDGARSGRQMGIIRASAPRPT